MIEDINILEVDHSKWFSGYVENAHFRIMSGDRNVRNAMRVVQVRH